MIRGTAANGEIRFFGTRSTDLVEKARKIHGTSPVVTAALGRLLTATVMMGSMMKSEEDRITVNINGDGPIGAICVTADSIGHVKGFVRNPLVILPANEKHKLDVSGAVGHGILNVIRDTGMKEPYNSSVDIVSGEIAEDITYYFATSEQVPSSVGLGVLMDKANFVKVAGGFIIQLMPGVKEETISALEKNLTGVDSVTNMLLEYETPEKMCEFLLRDLEPVVNDNMPVSFACDCSEQKVLDAITGMGETEILSLIKEGQDVETSCRFCGKKFSFTPKRLKEYFKL